MQTMVITPEQKEKLREIGNKHNLKFIILHGSYTKGNSRLGSDLDIAILGNIRVSFDELLQIHGELADIFGDNQERELDLKTLHNVDSLFRYQVVRDGTLLYGNPTEYQEFKAYAFRDYMDSKDLRELEAALLKKSVKDISEKYAG
jgi:predicted nucleotidyltransferase